MTVPIQYSVDDYKDQLTRAGFSDTQIAGIISPAPDPVAAYKEELSSIGFSDSEIEHITERATTLKP